MLILVDQYDQKNKITNGFRILFFNQFCVSLAILPARFRIKTDADNVRNLWVAMFLEDNLAFQTYCCGYGMFIPDLNFFTPRTGSRIKKKALDPDQLFSRKVTCPLFDKLGLDKLHFNAVLQRILNKQIQSVLARFRVIFPGKNPLNRNQVLSL